MDTDGSAAPGRQQWARLWRLWDIATMRMIPPGHHHDRPVELRQPFIFYLGHLPAFADSRLSLVLQQPLTEPANYADMFARGIDPDLDDPSRCHAHSPTPHQWPDVIDILAYRDRVRARILQLYQGSNSNASKAAIATSSSAQCLNINSCKQATSKEELASIAVMPAAVQHVLWMAYEHEAMHLETMLYLLVQYTALLPPPPEVLSALPEVLWCSILATSQLATTLLPSQEAVNHASCLSNSNRPVDDLRDMHVGDAAQQDHHIQCGDMPLSRTEYACSWDHHGAPVSTAAHGSLPAADGGCSSSGLSKRCLPHSRQQEHVPKQQQQHQHQQRYQQVKQQQQHMSKRPHQQQQQALLPLPPKASWVHICGKGVCPEVRLGFTPQHQAATQIVGSTAAAVAEPVATEQPSKFRLDSTITTATSGTTSTSRCCSKNSDSLSDPLRFGWDNECPARTVPAQQVSMQHRAVAVVEYLSFLAAQLADSSLCEAHSTQQLSVQASSAEGCQGKDGAQPASAAEPALPQAAAGQDTWQSSHSSRHDAEIDSDISRGAGAGVMKRHQQDSDVAPNGNRSLPLRGIDASNEAKHLTLPQMLDKMNSSTASVCFDCQNCLEQLLQGPSVASLVPASFDMRKAPVAADSQVKGDKDAGVANGSTNAQSTAVNWQYQHQHTSLADSCMLHPCRGLSCSSNDSSSACSHVPGDINSGFHPSCIMGVSGLDDHGGQQDFSPQGTVSDCYSPTVGHLKQERPPCQGTVSNLLVSGPQLGVLCTGLCKLVPGQSGRHRRVLQSRLDCISHGATCTPESDEHVCRQACDHRVPALLATINLPEGGREVDATASCSGSNGMVQAAASDYESGNAPGSASGNASGNAPRAAACAMLQTALLHSLQVLLGVKSVFGVVPCCISGYWPVYCSALQAEQYMTWYNVAHGMQCRLPSEADIAAARRHNALLSNRKLTTSNIAAAAAAVSQCALVTDAVSVEGSDGQATGLAQHSSSDLQGGSASPQSPSAATSSTELDGCSVNFTVWHPVCVPLRPSTVASSSVSPEAVQDRCREDKVLSETSQDTVAQLSDNGWEWTSTTFTRHEGFTPHPLYPEYSQDVFEGKHAVLLGGSWATVDSIAARTTFRNWYQRGQQHVFAKFRLCHSHGS